MNAADVLATAIRWHCPECGHTAARTYEDILMLGYPLCLDCNCELICDDELYDPDDEDE